MTVAQTFPGRFNAVRAAFARAPETARYWSAEWLMGFAVLSSLLLVVPTRGASLLVFLAALGVYVLLHLRRTAEAILPMAALFALPALALASTFWSDAPNLTLRYGAQFALTVFAGVLLARRGAGASLIGAIFCAFLLASVVAALGGVITPGTAFAGVFGSKNELALFASLLALSAAAVGVDGRQPGVLRLLALPGLALAAWLLILGQSAGATVTSILTGAVFLSLLAFSRMGVRFRGVAAAFLILAAPAVIFAAEPASRAAEQFMVERLGKDTTFTGRTYLWERAGEYVAQRPVLGHGYQAFWREGNLEAEGLWRYGHIDSRTGFNFHNQFIEVLVDLGWVGLVAFLATLGAGLIALTLRLLSRPTPTVVFAASLFLLMIARTPFESTALLQFYPPTLLLFLVLALGLSGERELRA